MPSNNASEHCGGLHLANPNATPLRVLNITLLGMLFGLGMVWTGSLAIPIGLHMAWNVFQNNIFAYRTVESLPRLPYWSPK